MTSPQTNPRRILTPAKRVLTAFIVLLTGSGVASVFFQIPADTGGIYEICDQNVTDQQIAAAPLPQETASHATVEEIQQMSLPKLDQAITADSGAGKYAQVYETPDILKEKILKDDDSPDKDFVPVSAAKVEPARKVIVQKPVMTEPVDKTFQEKPKNTFEVSKVNDQMISLFQFAENIEAEKNSKLKNVPEDPFPLTQLRPLEPLVDKTRSGLRPLQPL